MSLSTRLNYILTQNPALEKQKLLTQILNLLKLYITRAKLSKIICDSNSNNDYFIKHDKDDTLQINLSNDIGKMLLIKLIGLITNYYNSVEERPFSIIVKENINIRKIMFNYIKANKICKTEVFVLMMRSFIIVNQYKHLHKLY